MGINRNSSYYLNLIQSVIKNSEALDWESSVLEWEVFDCEEDEALEFSCICCKENFDIFLQYGTPETVICCTR